MIKAIYLGLTMMAICLTVHAQSNDKLDNLELYRHHIAYDDYQVSFYTLPADAKIGKVKLGREYFWLAGRQLNSTQNGYAGKLLHGDFYSFYLNKQLKEQGKFKNGLKIGEWKQWSEAGKMVMRTHYEQGLANGRFFKYNSVGELIEEGTYLNGKVNGKLKRYINQDSVAIFNYKNGIEYQKERKKWWKFWKK